MKIAKDRLSINEIKDYLGIDRKAKADVVSITPEQASVLLEFNIRNRKISKGAVSLLKKQLDSGEFCLSNDGISFNNEGVLTNGQHRLKAISESLVESAEIAVIFGVENFMGMDTGRKRSIQDNALIFDDCDERLREESRKVCLSVAKDAVLYCRGVYTGNKLSPKQYIDIANCLADDLILCFNEGLFVKTHGVSASPVLCALFLAHMNGVSMGTLCYIKEVLSDGILKRGDFDRPIISLRDKLQGMSGMGRDLSILRFCYTCSCIDKVVKKSKSPRLYKDKFLYTYMDIPHVKPYVA